jgi:hypothetical protein
VGALRGGAILHARGHILIPPRRTIIAAAVALLAAACGEYTVEPALLAIRIDTARLVVPDSVPAGEPFDVTFTVFAGGCTREVSRVDVRVRRATAEIRPKMRRFRSDVCTADLLVLSQKVRVRFDHPGVATVRLRGVRERPSAISSDDTHPMRVERRVRVTAGANEHPRPVPPTVGRGRS